MNERHWAIAAVVVGAGGHAAATVAAWHLLGPRAFGGVAVLLFGLIWFRSAIKVGMAGPTK